MSTYAKHSSIEEVHFINNKNDYIDIKKSPLYCELCDIKVTSYKILQRHLDGRKHRMRAERKGKTYVCDLCQIVANSEIQLNIHLMSSKHRYRIQKEEYNEFTAISLNWKGKLIILFCCICLFLNLLLLFEYIV